MTTNHILYMYTIRAHVKKIVICRPPPPCMHQNLKSFFYVIIFTVENFGRRPEKIGIFMLALVRKQVFLKAKTHISGALIMKRIMFYSVGSTLTFDKYVISPHVLYELTL